MRTTGDLIPRWGTTACSVSRFGYYVAPSPTKPAKQASVREDPKQMDAKPPESKKKANGKQPASEATRLAVLEEERKRESTLRWGVQVQEPTTRESGQSNVRREQSPAPRAEQPTIMLSDEASSEVDSPDTNDNQKNSSGADDGDDYESTPDVKSSSDVNSDFFVSTTSPEDSQNTSAYSDSKKDVATPEDDTKDNEKIDQAQASGGTPIGTEKPTGSNNAVDVSLQELNESVPEIDDNPLTDFNIGLNWTPDLNSSRSSPLEPIENGINKYAPEFKAFRQRLATFALRICDRDLERVRVDIDERVSSWLLDPKTDVIRQQDIEFEKANVFSSPAIGGDIETLVITQFQNYVQNKTPPAVLTHAGLVNITLWPIASIYFNIEAQGMQFITIQMWTLNEDNTVVPDGKMLFCKTNVTNEYGSTAAYKKKFIHIYSSSKINTRSTGQLPLITLADDSNIGLEQQKAYAIVLVCWRHHFFKNPDTFSNAHVEVIRDRLTNLKLIKSELAIGLTPGPDIDALPHSHFQKWFLSSFDCALNLWLSDKSTRIISSTSLKTRDSFQKDPIEVSLIRTYLDAPKISKTTKTLIVTGGFQDKEFFETPDCLYQQRDSNDEDLVEWLYPIASILEHKDFETQKMKLIVQAYAIDTREFPPLASEIQNADYKTEIDCEFGAGYDRCSHGEYPRVLSKWIHIYSTEKVDLGDIRIPSVLRWPEILRDFEKVAREKQGLTLNQQKSLALLLVAWRKFQYQESAISTEAERLLAYLTKETLNGEDFNFFLSESSIGLKAGDEFDLDSRDTDALLDDVLDISENLETP